MIFIICFIIGYIFVIPGMCCLVLHIDNLAKHKHTDVWPIAIAWPFLMIFIVVGAIIWCVWAWFNLFINGTKGFIEVFENDDIS